MIIPPSLTSSLSLSSPPPLPLAELPIESWFVGDIFTKAFFKDSPYQKPINPESVKLTKFDTVDGRFMVRVELEKSYIEIPISLKDIAEWQRRRESQVDDDDEEE